MRPSVWLLGWLAAVHIAACGPKWPRVSATVHPQFAHGQLPVETVDILPLDVDVGVHQQSQVAADRVAQVFYAVAYDELDARLREVGYDVRAHIGWDGGGDDGRPLMAAGDVETTAGALATFASYQAAMPPGARLLTPFLPTRLGEQSGADATLYVGGFAYHGTRPPMPTWGKVLIGVVVVALIVVIVIAAAKAGGGGGGGAGGVAKAAGNAAAQSARLVASAGRLALRAAAVTTRVGVRVVEGVARSCCVELYLPEQTAPVAEGEVVMESHPPTLAAPVPLVPATLPEMPSSGPSRIYVEMTLVHNATGAVLWHARQIFPADPNDPDQVRRAIASMLRVMPVRARR